MLYVTNQPINFHELCFPDKLVLQTVSWKISLLSGLYAFLLPLAGTRDEPLLSEKVLIVSRYNVCMGGYWKIRLILTTFVSWLGFPVLQRTLMLTIYAHIGRDRCTTTTTTTTTTNNNNNNNNNKPIFI